VRKSAAKNIVSQFYLRQAELSGATLFHKILGYPVAFVSMVFQNVVIPIAACLNMWMYQFLPEVFPPNGFLKIFGYTCFVNTIWDATLLCQTWDFVTVSSWDCSNDFAGCDIATMNCHCSLWVLLFASHVRGMPLVHCAPCTILICEPADFSLSHTHASWRQQMLKSFRQLCIKSW